MRISVIYTIFLAALGVSLALIFALDLTLYKNYLGQFILSWFTIFFVFTLFAYLDALSSRLLSRKLPLTDKEEQLRVFLSITVASLAFGYAGNTLFNIIYGLPSIPLPFIFATSTIVAFTIGIFGYEIERIRKLEPDLETQKPEAPQPQQPQPSPPPKGYTYVGKPPNDRR